MKIKVLSLATLLAFSASGFAQDYRFFSNAGVTSFKDFDLDVYSVNAQYYFSPIESRGPFQEFDYLITESTIGASYSHSDASQFSRNTYGVSGQLFYGDFLIGGNYLDTDDDNFSNVSLGYLFSPNFLLKVDLPSDSASDAVVSATYQHNLSNKAYIGFTASVDSELDSASISTRYFKPISSGRYIALVASFADADGGSSLWSLGGNYYFNQYSSLGASFSDEFVMLNASHFFTPQLSVSGRYSFFSDDFGSDNWGLQLSYQF